MKFHLNHIPGKSPFSIDHTTAILLTGSCFAENIGTLLTNFKFKTRTNPGGTLFNPASIHTFLTNVIHAHKADEHFFLERASLVYSYLHHSSFSAASKKELAENIDGLTQATHRFLKTADVLIITFGTAYTYHHKILSQTVANCHKQPAGNFHKKLMEVEEITTTYTALIRDLKILNPGLKIIFTVSPVKYLKEGVEENNVSKSTLLLGVHKLVTQHPNCFYFPAFELVSDDLRDYRFYKEDLAHPNQMAVDYVWQKFSECYFSPATIELNRQIHKLNLALSHRQMQENSLEADKLRTFIEKQKEEIRKSDPGIQF